MRSKVKTVILGISFIIIAFVIQKTASTFGGWIADLFAYDNNDVEKFDPYIIWITIHHIMMMLATLFIIMILKRIFKKDFGLKLGNRKTGVKYSIIVTIILIFYALLFYSIMYLLNQSFIYDYSLNAQNIVGYLGFQLFISGPSEEILFRAIPITLFLIIFRRSIHIKWGISLEVVMAALLFSIAHTNLSLIPFQISLDNWYQLIYALITGIVFGVIYQKTDSIIYPMYLHSISNVIMVGFGYIFSMI